MGVDFTLEYPFKPPMVSCHAGTRGGGSIGIG